MKSWISLSAWLVVGLLTPGAVVCGQTAQPAIKEAVDAADPSEVSVEDDTAVDGATAADKEETGMMFGVIHDRVEPMNLPPTNAPWKVAVDNGWRPANQGGGLFPSQMWEQTLIPVRNGDADVNPSALMLGADRLVATSVELSADNFNQAPPPLLHDPQSLFSPAEQQRLSGLIAAELNRSGGFEVRIMAIQPSQKLPAALDPSSMIRQWFPGKMGALMTYPVKRPQEIQAFFSPEAYQAYGFEPLRHIIEAGSADAASLTGTAAQLERFVYMTGLRLQRLAESARLAALSGKEASSSTKTTTLWWVYAVGIQAALLTGGAIWWHRRHRRHHGRFSARHVDEIILLPEQKCYTRLGGDFSGGSSGVVQFSEIRSRI